jgi:hypothetical protein
VSLTLQFVPIAGRIDAGKCFFFKTRRNQLHIVVTDGRVRDTGVLVRTRNSGENEANFFHRQIRRKNNFLKNESADANVSRGQMRDKIVANPDAFR